MKRPRVRLIHWKAEEAAGRLALLRKAGFAAVHEVFDGPGLFRALSEQPPDAVVIDLSRLPSHGREVGQVLRSRKSTRHLPLVFAGGDPEKAGRIRSILPDAVFCRWDSIAESVRAAIANQPAEPVRPPEYMAAYAGRPLPAKLGVKPATELVLFEPPEDFAAKLGHPDAAGRRKGNLYIWFVRDAAQLNRLFRQRIEAAKGAPMWVAWPKKASGVATDLTQTVVRKAGLDLGWVDYKICAIDETWSALLFRERRQNPG